MVKLAPTLLHPPEAARVTGSELLAEAVAVKLVP
jgi:hypothetical protein